MSNNNQYQPANDPKVFFRQVRAAVLEPLPYLAHNHWYCLKDLLAGSDLWDETDGGTHIRAGRSFGWMVDNELAPFERAPRSDGQTGTRHYLYVGPEIYQGGE